MANFVLEIFSEEIPASMQKIAQENFRKIVIEQLQKNFLQFEEKQLRTFIAPCRLGFILTDILLTFQSQIQKKIGPKIDANPNAINGFLKSLGLESIEDLGQNDGYYFYNIEQKEISSAEIIQNSLPNILQKMQNSWAKLMRFDIEGQDIQAKWIRPIRNILALFDDKIIDYSFAKIKSNNHSFINDNLGEAIIINDASQYEIILENQLVLIDSNKRKDIITKQVKTIIKQHNIELVIDIEKSNLLDEVIGLVDYPELLLAKIDKSFLELPDEALILTLQQNQKYFCCKNNDGSLSNFFIFAINKKIDSSYYPKIIKDNEKIAKARLSDIKFFIEEDLKIPLENRLSELNKIIFHRNLGSVFDKVLRIKSIAKFMAVFIPHCEINLIDKVSELSKVDLTTKAVAELPELQGKIGSFYALKQGFENKIAMAIYEHYLPIADSQLPQTPLGIAISLADKIDSVVGFFLINEKPTSSKDPFALRRSVLGIIRIAIKYDLALPIRILIEKSLQNFPLKLQKTFLQNDEYNFYEIRKKLIEEIVIFFVERLKIYLKDQEQIRLDVLNVVIDEYLGDIDAHRFVDIIYLRKKIVFLNQFVNDLANQNIINLYKRSTNILTIEEKKDQQKYCGKPSILGLKSQYEKILNRRIKQIYPEFNKFIIKGEFQKAFDLLAIIESPLKNFFDNVMVNDDDKHLRENRLLLLSRIRSLFARVGDLSNIKFASQINI